MRSFINTIKDIPGWSTKRKIVVIESDDWGSIRMPSKKAFNNLVRTNPHIASNRYCRFDNLANQQDLEALYEVFRRFRDGTGRHPVMTAVAIAANPDFGKIEASGFRDYHYEPFTETLGKYFSDSSSIWNLWQEGIKERLFIPVFHGREHLNVHRWLKALQAGHPATLEAFREGTFGLPLKPEDGYGQDYMAAFDFESEEELPQLEEILRTGLDMFEQLFGWRASYFVPPVGPLSTRLEPALSRYGIKNIQTARLIYKEPAGKGKTIRRFRYLGRKNSSGQKYFVRNCVFEPNENESMNWVGFCMGQIDKLFAHKKPVIITSHRVNFIGNIDEQNRTRNLALLSDLLHQITTKYPDAEFMTSDELADAMN